MSEKIKIKFSDIHHSHQTNAAGLTIVEFHEDSHRALVSYISDGNPNRHRQAFLELLHRITLITGKPAEFDRDTFPIYAKYLIPPYSEEVQKELKEIASEDIGKAIRKSMHDTWDKIMTDFEQTAKMYHDDPRWIASPKKRKKKKNGN